MNILTPENLKIVQGANPQTTNGGIDGDYISLKNVVSVRVEVDLTQAAGHATEITLYQATAVAGTGEKALASNVTIWANEDTATSDTLVRQSNGVSYTVSNDIKNKKVAFYILPAKLDMNNNYDCICAKIGDSATATNYACINYVIEPEFHGETPPSDIVD